MTIISGCNFVSKSVKYLGINIYGQIKMLFQDNYDVVGKKIQKIRKMI